MSYTIITRGKLNFPTTKKPQLDYDGHNFLLTTPFGNNNRLKEEVQVTWDKKYRRWVLPDLILYANTALEMYPDLPITEKAHARLIHQDEESLTRPLSPYKGGKGYVEGQVFDRLYPFQQDSVFRLVNDPRKNQQVVLSPGLGKTVVSLLAARILGAKSVLVICIKDLVLQWQDEEEKWFGERTLLKLHGEAPMQGPWWYVANYDTVVGRLHTQFETRHWDVVIIDESVLVKNRKTQRFKRLLDLRHKDVGRFWELSGSPATKTKADLWTQMHLLYPEDFRSFWRFAKRFCVVESSQWSMATIVDDRQDRDTKEDLRDLQFVRHQKDVLKDLPEEIPVLIPVELTVAQRKAYDEMNRKFITELEEGKKVTAAIKLSQLIRLQQITSNLVNLGGEDNSTKADAVVDMLEARSFSMPCLIWVNWVPGAKALLARLRKVAPELRIEWIHGAESKKDELHNEEVFTAYKAGKVDILILALTVGRFGHNLPITQTVIYYDKSWDADAWNQSMKRVKRIGLDHRPVVITLKAVGTTDEMIELNIAGKLPSIASISNDDLASMLRSLTGGD